MSRFRPIATLMLAGLAMAFCSASLTAEEFKTFEEILGDVAKEIADQVGDQTVSIGLIIPTNSPKSLDGLPLVNGGPSFGDRLRRELEKLKPRKVLAENATFEIQGSFGLVPHPGAGEEGQKVLKLNLTIVTVATQESSILPITRLFKKNADIAVLYGISGPIPLDHDKDRDQNAQRRERNQAIQELIKEPKTFVDPAHPTLVSSSEGSPYRVEILAGPLGDGKVRPTVARRVRLEKGLAFVEVERGEVYEVRIHNASPDEVAAKIFVDGIDVFQFSDDRDPKDPAKPKFSHFIVAGQGATQTIPGWHKCVVGRENFLSFLVTAYGQGVSTKGVSAQGAVGVIQVQFSRIATPGLRSAGNETGFGPPRERQQQEVKREIEPPTDIVSIRYTR